MQWQAERSLSTPHAVGPSIPLTGGVEGEDVGEVVALLTEVSCWRVLTAPALAAAVAAAASPCPSSPDLGGLLPPALGGSGPPRAGLLGQGKAAAATELLNEKCRPLGVSWVPETASVHAVCCVRWWGQHHCARCSTVASVAVLSMLCAV